MEVREPREHSRGRGEFKVRLEMKAGATAYPKSNAKQLKGFKQKRCNFSLEDNSGCCGGNALEERNTSGEKRN